MRLCLPQCLGGQACRGCVGQTGVLATHDGADRDDVGRAVYARAIRDHPHVGDQQSLVFKEGDIIRVVEQGTNGMWQGHVDHSGRTTKPSMFPADYVVLVNSQEYQQHKPEQHKPEQHKPEQHKLEQHKSEQHKPEQHKPGQMKALVPDREHAGSSSDWGRSESSSTEDCLTAAHYSFSSAMSSSFPPLLSSTLQSCPPRTSASTDLSSTDSGFSSVHGLPQHRPGTAQQQFGKSSFVLSQSVPASTGLHSSYISTSTEHHHHRHQQHDGEWSPASTPLPNLGGTGGDMRGTSPARDSPGHSNRSSGASSDSGRGCSTGHADAKSGHSHGNVQVIVDQNRLSGQSCESGVSSRQSYHSTSSSSHSTSSSSHSTSSSSHGSLDRLEEPGFASTISIDHLFQAGVPDNEVLHAWLHDLHFQEYYPLFMQAGYDMPTISRMTPEDLTAVGITIPAHRKRLKTEIARLNIHDGIPDFRPSDLMEWLHLLGLGAYLDTLCGQGYDNLDSVSDITWEDLEEVGIQKLGHQKKIMLAIERLKRLSGGEKYGSASDGRMASLELLEPPPPAPPMTGLWAGGEISAITPYIYDGAQNEVKTKTSSGDSISTTCGSGSVAYCSGGSVAYCSGVVHTDSVGGKVISLPKEDGVPVEGMPYQHSSTGSADTNTQPSVLAIQVRKHLRSNSSDSRKDMIGHQLMYQSFQGTSAPDNEAFMEKFGSRSFDADCTDRCKPSARVTAMSEAELCQPHFDAQDKSGHDRPGPKIGANNNNNNNNISVRVEGGDHIYDTPHISSPLKSPKPTIKPKPAALTVSPFTGSVHLDQSVSRQATPSQRGRKIPPTPPKRTDSIRAESTSESTPSSPSKILAAPNFITVAASIHSQPSNSAIIKQPTPPPLVMQKPMSPAMTSKLQQQHLQQQHLPKPLVTQKPQSPKPASQKVIILPTVHPLLQSATPARGTQPQLVISKPAPVISKPAQPTHIQQPKSPLPTKSPFMPMVSSVTKHQPSHQPSSSPLHKQIHTVSMSQSGQQQPKAQAAVLPSQHVSPFTAAIQGYSQQPQVQAFASCVKSLSEKFGKNTDQDDSCPDNVSIDSDDFPPPPPPIAMDIITPKIHNYGIPSSRDRGRPEYGLLHHRENTHKPYSNCSFSRIQPELSQKNLSRSPGQQPQPTEVPTPTKQPNVSSSPANDSESSPDPDSLNAISKEKRSESTSSFESNSSSSSIDSNTLPFANENVGTIKQRTVNVKPTSCQSLDTESGQRTPGHSPLILDNKPSASVPGYSNSLSSHSSSSSSSNSQNMNTAMTETCKNYMNSVNMESKQSKYGQSNPSLSSSGVLQPPVQNKKPALRPKPTKPQTKPSSSPQQQPLPTAAEEHREVSNVLSDIDEMLQGLTDELDAMLEEEMAN